MFMHELFFHVEAQVWAHFYLIYIQIYSKVVWIFLLISFSYILFLFL